MAQVRITGGVLNVAEGGGGEIDNTLPGGPLRPGHDLPPSFPPIGSTLPEPPPGIWPPITGWAPIQPAPPGTPPGVIWPPIGRPVDPGYGRPGIGAGHPDTGLPPSPGHPDTGLPPSPGLPDQGLPPSPGHPDAGLPVPPSGTLPVPPPVRPDHGLPSKTFYVVCGIPGVGWRYVTVDPSLDIGYPLPPHAQPK